ncbi:hypothetical protein H6P81_015035 [Aristolochia fimbriata]|uniref:Hydroxyproline-rich glycoprotein family protein n=1 Tax=Aristolochia fimbriata TaxID=158543 RepID=A0AAV7E6E1_ARIFI|nr:hypothetical protein H6P81_015035 [Aristolochia fimbriata]
MRGRSSKQSKEAEKPRNREEPHISGAYIRSLVKQLTSSKTKDPMNPKAASETAGDHGAEAPNLSAVSVSGQKQTQQSPSPQPKKQVRRRLHTSRPYQERLLNMAEARREIVTALKFHRAAMKQASEQQQQSSQQQPQAPPCHLEPVLEKMKTGKNSTPRIFPSNDTTTFSNYLNNYSYPAFSSTTTPISWSSPTMPPLCINDSFNLTLPNQPLGLNLNFHDFNNMDASFYNNNNNPSIFLQSTTHSSSSSLSSPSPSLSPPMCVEAPSIPNAPTSPPGTHLHHAMDDEEMAEIRLIGEQHEMEWNDRVNLVTSAWWFKFLKTMEMSPGGSAQEEMIRGDEDGFHFLDEMMDIPAWLNDGPAGNAPESCFLQQHWDDLPCLDIGEIEAMDGDWLA